MIHRGPIRRPELDPPVMVEAQILHRGERLSLTRHEAPAMELLGILEDALAFSPPIYPWSILGLPSDLLPPYRRFAEIEMLDLRQLPRALSYLVDLTVPSLPIDPPECAPSILDELFWDPSKILRFPDHNGSYTTFADESWIFINGVATNGAVARLNAGCLSDLFHRPLTVIQNSTESLLLDLVQCAVGKQCLRATEPAIRAFPVLHEALADPEKRRVVVVAHSQGTIIAANLLRMLYEITVPGCTSAGVRDREVGQGIRFGESGMAEELNLDEFDPLSEDELCKLELYCFATCATELNYYRPPANGMEPTPWIEHFGNERDLVARLGMQAPRPERWHIEIDGPTYVNPGRWGHLLNMHYLFDLADGQRVVQGREARGPRSSNEVSTGKGGPSRGAYGSVPEARPRLLEYLDGGRPDPPGIPVS